MGEGKSIWILIDLESSLMHQGTHGKVGEPQSMKFLTHEIRRLAS
jgi:hypothetical protein